MDERSSKVFGGFFSYRGNKIYFNYTDHLMNNGLRTTYSTMKMETNSKNLTVGLTGSSYEIIYRNWNADNFITMPEMGHYISNKLMPNVDQIGVSASTNISTGNFQAYVKGGLQYFRFKDHSRIDFYKSIYPETRTNIYYLSAGLLLSYSSQLSRQLIFMTTTEFASEAPDAEQLFIAVNRPMNNPDWSGNPALKSVNKFSLRTSLKSDLLDVELFGNYILNYIEVTRKTKPMKSVMTYENINALIAGTNLTFRYHWLESNLSFLWGENLENKKPLAEIAPLSIYSVLRLPEIYGLNISINHRHENTQTRVNEDLKEYKTPSWNSLGVIVGYTIKDVTFNFQINNLLNHKYARYLSSSRSPFSAGNLVYDLGRYITFTINLNKSL